MTSTNYNYGQNIKKVKDVIENMMHSFEYYNIYGDDIEDICKIISGYKYLENIEEISINQVENILNDNDYIKIYQDYGDEIKIYILKCVNVWKKIDIFFSLSKCTPNELFFIDNNFLLKVAITNNNSTIVKFLLELGIDVSIDNYLAFKLIESVDILDLFLEYYPDIDINMYNDFAIRYAAKKANAPYVYALIKRGANIDAYNGEILYFLVKSNYPCDNYESIINALKKSNQLDKYGPKIIRICIDDNKFEIIKFLVDYGINLDFLTHNDIYQIILSGSNEQINFYYDHGVNFTAVNNLTISMSEENNKFFDNLIEYGVDMELIGKYMLIKNLN
ncbi:putative ankyrin repeat protein [Powai lake megavirus]|uniref:Putative ankyrin repeat protein n=1 Tax=Powai lake megavirus TaxID=1842663 RepID=A0A167RL18_9VIRU|nr:putative ankyrin repeat protein [Powai lake megavirus]ANB50813.1 putative ankyrin repeat protein [Powai lake megavirus]